MSDPTRKRLLERTFKYTRASETDIAATFKRIRKAQKEAAAVLAAALPTANVKPIRKVAK